MNDQLYIKLKYELQVFYLIQLIRTTNTNPEFLQRIFCLFKYLFEYFYKVCKSFKLVSQYEYTQKCQYNPLY